ncbi:hypothetical protein PCC7418_3168 [Halothece sp. PCC 7418]|uniref:hypothetical protein n=1 Tax=Halothece sp. (strain PCC 7418) TaxID=65093 RepID=UPI0002A06258|nr:hypothetical protein [Halothece sp. PCC 7418]AFZ45287.1 hypothetical protein PCC7418_3168 [Halothece sp. PCC 7418]
MNRWEQSIKEGNKSEKTFLKLAVRRGYQVLKSSKQQDINEHWDYEITKNDATYKVDVKAKKRISRQDKTVQSEEIWIELHSVRANNKGWLYESKANLLAFELEDGFLLVKREDLINLVNKIVNFDEQVSLAKDALYKVYSRRDQVDKITRIRAEDAKGIQFDYWHFLEGLGARR